MEHSFKPSAGVLTGVGHRHELAIMTTYEMASGSIVHVELNSDDVEASGTFLADAFGWNVERDDEMNYTVWRAPNPPGGGLLGPQDGEVPEGAPFEPPSTLFYVDVEDLAEAREAIVEAGGELLVEEMEIPEMGAFTVFREPGGVVEAAWENRYEGDPPEGGWPAYTDDPEPGSVTHFELYSEDPGATCDFHEAVFGWAFETVEGSDYTMVYPPTPPYGGVMQATEEMPVGTLFYLLVEDAEAACEAVAGAGASVLREPFEVEGWGTMAVFEAPGGVVLALWEGVTGTAEAPSSEEAPGREAI